MPISDSSQLVAAARDIAIRAHAGQTDKAGHDYIHHPERVAYAVARTADPVVVAVAWLHDVLEDCEGYEAEIQALLPTDGWEALNKLTRRDGQSDADYYAAIHDDVIARVVKIADIGDNSDPGRLSLLPKDVADRLRRKYRKALAALV